MKNRCLSSNNKTGIHGVKYLNDKYQVNINAFGKRINLGKYIDFFEACCIRKSAEIKYKYHPNHGRKK